MKNPYRNLFLLCITLAMACYTLSCDPLVTRFEDQEDGMFYTAKHKITQAAQVDTIRVMTWNIRFGVGRILWFGDSCGDRVIVPEAEVLANLSRLAAAINDIKPDILLMQEVDVQSKRSGYIDQVQWLLDHTFLNYGAYASVWQAQIVPSDGLGRMDMGIAVLSRWKITEAERIQLQLRGDQDALTKYFYLRRCILRTKIALPGVEQFYVVNTHLDAFSSDDTRKKQIDRLKTELDRLNHSGAYFVAGGDFNLLPPGSDSTDFCDEDKCPDESFHGPHDDPKHKEGSYFTPVITWLQDLYDSYQPDVPLDKYRANQSRYFTHSPDPDRFWDRKIDYLFTNYRWIDGSAITHQDLTNHSDHIPVSIRWEVPK